MSSLDIPSSDLDGLRSHVGIWSEFFSAAFCSSRRIYERGLDAGRQRIYGEFLLYFSALRH